MILCWRSPAINTNFGFLKKLEAPKFLWRQHFVLTVTSHQHKIYFFWKNECPKNFVTTVYFVLTVTSHQHKFWFSKKIGGSKIFVTTAFCVDGHQPSTQNLFFSEKMNAPKILWRQLIERRYKLINIFSSSTGSIACDDCPMGCNHVIFCSPCVNMTIESLDFIFFWVCANL